MKNLKKTIKILGMVCVAVAGLSCMPIVYIIRLGDKMTLIANIVSIALSLTTGIMFLVVSKKGNSYILTHRNLFLWITLLNIFNNLIVWGLSLWAEIVVLRSENERRFNEIYAKMTIKPPDTTNDIENASIQNKVIILSNKLSMLGEQMKRKEITPEEYKKMRQEIIDKYI